MNQAHQFIQVYLLRGSQKLLVQCGTHYNSCTLQV